MTATREAEGPERQGLGERRQLGEENEALVHNLGERVKELNCLLAISSLAGRAGVSLSEVLQGSAEFLAPAMQYPEVAAARIVLDDQEYSTPSYRRTRWHLSAALHDGERRCGAVEVCYLEKRPRHDRGPFLTEERRLLQAVSGLLGNFVQNQRRAEELAESHALLTAVLDGTPVSMALLDPEGNYLVVNRAYAADHRCEPASFLGKNLLDIFPVPGGEDVFRRVAETGQPYFAHSMPLAHPGQRDSGVTYWDRSLVPLLGPDGAVEKLLLTSVNVSERRSTEHQYRALFEQSLQGIMLLQGVPPRITLANARCAEMTGYSLDELLSFQREDFAALVHPDDRERLFRELADHFSGREVSRVGEYRAVRKDGEVRVIRTFASLLSHGGVPSLQMAFLDITGRKRAEDALRRAYDDLERQVQERTAALSAAVQGLRQEAAERELTEKELARSHRLVLALNRVTTQMRADPDIQAVLDELGSAMSEEGLVSAVLLLDEAGQTLTVRHVSGPPGAAEHFERATGFPLVGYCFAAGQWPFADAVAQGQEIYVLDQEPVLAAMLDKPAPQAINGILEAFQMGSAQPAVYVPLVTEERVLGILMIGGAGLKEVDVPAIEVLAGQTASTLERLRLTREAAEVTILREVDRLRSELIANVSHEIRTPLGLIDILSSSLLMEDVTLDPEVSREFLLGIREATARLAGLVENLLDMGRIEGGKLGAAARSVDLAALVRDFVPGLVLPGTGHSLVLDLAPDLLVEGDAVQLERVLANLVSNAVKYSPAGGIIRVTGQAEEGQVRLSVSDEGIGIPAEEQERVFQRFYRVESEWTETIPGIGLGLAVCRGIVYAHGGRLWVESEPGTGSTFHVLLPGQADQASGAGQGESAEWQARNS